MTLHFSGSYWYERGNPLYGNYKAKRVNMNLKQHIQEHHNGNVTSYAKEYGTSRQQMEKWLKLDCRVIHGIIYRPVAKHRDQTTTALKV